MNLLDAWTVCFLKGTKSNVQKYFINQIYTCWCSTGLSSGIFALFLIYVNDVSENMLSLCRLYADDNSLQCSLNRVHVIEQNVNHDFKVLDKWSKQWLLQFNPNKTKAMFFSMKRSVDPPNLMFQQCQIEYVSIHKHLGIMFSEDFSWSFYINSLVNSAYKKFGLLKKLKYTVCRNTLSKMYTFVRPKLE
jgi:hypothetical protein